MKIKTLSSLCLVLLSVFISGCYSMPRTYGTIWQRNISPIYPTMNYSFSNRYKTIDTLKPELKWTDIKTANRTYDLCIWQGPNGAVGDSTLNFGDANVSWGTPIYVTNNLTENFHLITRRLQPNTYYNWAVRVHEGEKVGAWSSFRQNDAVIGGNVFHRNFPFGFKTADIR